MADIVLLVMEMRADVGHQPRDPRPNEPSPGDESLGWGLGDENRGGPSPQSGGVVGAQISTTPSG